MKKPIYKPKYNEDGEELFTDEYAKSIDLSQKNGNCTPEKMNSNMKNKIEPKEIIEIVCKHFNLDESKLQMSFNSRKRTYTYPRFICWGLIRTFKPEITLKQIGEMFGGYHHSTVLFGIGSFEELRKQDAQFNKDFRTIFNLINLKSYDLG